MDKLHRAGEELADICREAIPTDEPGFFEETIRSLNREIFLESARSYGTPHYFLDSDALKERASFFAETMRRHVPRSEFFYAFKCNDLPFIVRTLKETGFKADVAGIFELQLALKLGFERIVFSGPGKSDEELRLALKEKKRVIINIDNFDELERLKTLSEEKRSRGKVDVGFRLNTEVSSEGQWWKFGFELDELREAVRRVNQSSGLAWAGLHFHCSWNKTPLRYQEIIRKLSESLTANFSPVQLRKLRFLDIGGGYYPEYQGILHKGEDKGMLLDILGTRRGSKRDVYNEMSFDPYAFGITPVEPLENFARAIGDALEKNIFPFNPGIAVYFEPGRFIVAHSTSIILGVTSVKKNGLIVDGGINMLGDYKFSEYSFAPVVNISRPSSRLKQQVIYGPLCDPHDLWGYSYYGEDAQKGDIFAVLFQGAYTFSTAWRFIRPIPSYIAASGGRFSIAREAETFRDRYAGCRF
jgi:diaminopimelate decarboxylase